MDSLQRCCKTYQALENIEYRFEIARKGQSHLLTVSFTPERFQHLAGLGKLKNLAFKGSNAHQRLKDIESGKLTYKKIEKDPNFAQVSEKVHHLHQLESLMDCKFSIHQYDKNKAMGSRIEARYVISGTVDGVKLYLYIDKEPSEMTFFPRSFCPEKIPDPTVGQTKMTLLQKEKLTVCRREMQLVKSR